MLPRHRLQILPLEGEEARMSFSPRFAGHKEWWWQCLLVPSSFLSLAHVNTVYCCQPPMINSASPERDQLPFLPKVTSGAYKNKRGSPSPYSSQLVYFRLLKSKHAQIWLRFVGMPSPGSSMNELFPSPVCALFCTPRKRFRMTETNWRRDLGWQWWP